MLMQMLRVIDLHTGLLQLHPNRYSYPSQVSGDGLTAAKGKRRVVQVLSVGHVVWGLFVAGGHIGGRLKLTRDFEIHIMKCLSVD
jgi:hypothetical protein